MELISASQLMSLCQEKNSTIPQIVALYESRRQTCSVQNIRTLMERSLQVMQDSIKSGIEDSGERAHLVKGYAQKILQAQQENKLLGGEVLTKAILYSLAVAQHNAGLGRIVACPTAGSCGVVPGALLSIAEIEEVDHDTLIDSLLVVAGVGTVTAAQGPIAGAEGGCQAECGVASAMAAAALVYMQGGDNEQIFSAASLALQGLLGLVCDPIAGLVEAPCVTRNATAAVNAITAANMSLAGIPSLIPYDETVQAMKAVGKAMPESLRETSQGGLAATPTGKRIYQELISKYGKSI